MDVWWMRVDSIDGFVVEKLGYATGVGYAWMRMMNRNKKGNSLRFICCWAGLGREKIISSLHSGVPSIPAGCVSQIHRFRLFFDFPISGGVPLAFSGWWSSVRWGQLYQTQGLHGGRDEALIRYPEYHFGCVSGWNMLLAFWAELIWYSHLSYWRRILHREVLKISHRTYGNG